MDKQISEIVCEDTNLFTPGSPCGNTCVCTGYNKKRALRIEKLENLLNGGVPAKVEQTTSDVQTV